MSFAQVLERLSEAATNRQLGRAKGTAVVNTRDLEELLDDWRRLDFTVRMQAERALTPVYLYRRKGFQTWATCDHSRFVELSTHELFVTKVCFEAVSEPDTRIDHGPR